LPELLDESTACKIKLKWVARLDSEHVIAADPVLASTKHWPAFDSILRPTVSCFIPESDRLDIEVFTVETMSSTAALHKQLKIKTGSLKRCEISMLRR
jgi:hypothetical protein